LFKIGQKKYREVDVNT